MSKSAWIKLGILALIVLVIVVAGWVLSVSGIDFTKLSPERARELAGSFGIWAPVVYIAVYAQPIVPLPASILTSLAGVAFGKGWGLLIALIGATGRACSEFLVARLLGRGIVEKLLKGKVASLDQKLGENSFKAVLLIRLIPNLPFDVQNYGLGFSKVKFLPYALASFIGMIPGSFAFVYLGESLTNPKQIWKLGIAILIIIGLILIQRFVKARQQKKPSGSTVNA